MMTFNVCQNVDTLIPNCHPALLGALYLYLLNNHDDLDRLPEWLGQTYIRLQITADMLLNSIPEFTYYGRLMQSNIEDLWKFTVTEAEDLPHKCEDLSKYLLVALVSPNGETLVKQGYPYLVSQYLYREVSKLDLSTDSQIIEYFKQYLNIDLSPKISDLSAQIHQDCQSVIDNYMQDVQDGQYLQYYHTDDLSSDLKNRIMQGLEVVKSTDLVDTFSTFLQQQISQTRKYQPDEWITLLPKYSKVNLHTLNRFYQETTGESPDMGRINLSQVLVYLGLHSKLSNYEFMQNYNSGKHLDINSVNQDLNYAIISIVNHTVRQTFQNVIDNVVKVATDKYLEQHQLIHSEMPELLSRSECDSLIRHGESDARANMSWLEIKDLYRDGIALHKHACHNRNCPYFMIPRRDISSHLSQSREYPVGLHKTVYNCIQNDVPKGEIINRLADGNYLRPIFDHDNQSYLVLTKMRDEIERDIELVYEQYMSKLG